MGYFTDILINGGWIGVKSPTDPITFDPFDFLSGTSKCVGSPVKTDISSDEGMSSDYMHRIDSMVSNHDFLGIWDF